LAIDSTLSCVAVDAPCCLATSRRAVGRAAGSAAFLLSAALVFGSSDCRTASGLAYLVTAAETLAASPGGFLTGSSDDCCLATSPSATESAAGSPAFFVSAAEVLWSSEESTATWDGYLPWVST